MHWLPKNFFHPPPPNQGTKCPLSYAKSLYSLRSIVYKCIISPPCRRLIQKIKSDRNINQIHLKSVRSSECTRITSDFISGRNYWAPLFMSDRRSSHVVGAAWLLTRYDDSAVLGFESTRGSGWLGCLCVSFYFSIVFMALNGTFTFQVYKLDCSNVQLQLKP